MKGFSKFIDYQQISLNTWMERCTPVDFCGITDKKQTFCVLRFEKYESAIIVQNDF